MKNLLIAISNSATISSEGLIVQLLGVLIADVLIMDPHNAHLAISRFVPHASRRAPALIAGPHSDMPATELVAPMPPSAPADHLACSEKPSASWRQRGGLAACGAALVFLSSTVIADPARSLALPSVKAQLDETMREEGRRLFEAQHDLRRPAR